MVCKMEGRITIRHLLPLLSAIVAIVFGSCQEQTGHTAPAILARDSVPIMTSYGVNTLISDSGVIKYRIITEEWIVNENVNPSRWIFPKGVLLVQFDQTLHIQAYISADSVIYYDKQRLWKLYGRVRIHTKQGTDFASEELFWDENKHEVWSHRFSRLTTPDRRLQGNYFKSDEQMTHYIVTNTSGSFTRGDIGENPLDTMSSVQADSARKAGRQPMQHRPKTMVAR